MKRLTKDQLRPHIGNWVETPIVNEAYKCDQEQDPYKYKFYELNKKDE